MYFSHDHGFYLTGPDWTVEDLEQAWAADFSLVTDPAGLDGGELRRLADALDSLRREELEAEISKVPASWPVTDAELDAVVDFADRRRPPVAARLRALVP